MKKAQRVVLLTPGRLGYLPADGKISSDVEWYPYIWPSKHRMINMACKAHIHSSIPFQSIWYRWRKQLASADAAILFDTMLAPQYAKYIIKHYPNIRIIIWYSNPVANTVNPRLFPPECELWTFDKQDSQKYKMNWNSQFYYPFEIREAEKTYDICFIGQDKGRYEFLRSFAEQCQKKKITTDIHIVDQKKKAKANPLITDHFFRYEDIIQKHYAHSLAILDITQEGQNGFSLRPLEALFYEKKLITNNKEILNCSFYHPQNHYYIDDIKNIDYDKLKIFLQSHGYKYSEEEKRYYRIENWVNRFFQE